MESSPSLAAARSRETAVRRSRQLQGVKEASAGLVGGFAQVLSGHPFDTVKVRLQTQGTPPKYAGFIDCVRVTIKEEGLRGLFKGVTSPLLGVGICNSVLFSVQSRLKTSVFPAPNPNDAKPIYSENARQLLIGAASGAVISLVNCPIELLKIKLQVQYNSPTDAILKDKYSGVLDAMVKILSKEGPLGLYRGYAITLLRDVPSFACYFGTYETLKPMLLASSGADSTMGLLISGGLAGIAAWLPCFPQDVIKSRKQRDPTLTYRQIVKSVYSEGGLRGFFKGFSPCLIRAFPANAATFVAYEWCRNLLADI